MISANNSCDLELRVIENLMHFGCHTERRIQESFLKLDVSCFYNPSNAQLFAMIKDCFRKEEPFNFVDILVLVGNTDDGLHSILTRINENYRLYHTSDSFFEMDVDKLVLLSIVRKQLVIAERLIVEVKNCTSPEKAHEIMIEKVNRIASLNYLQTKYGITNIELSEDFYDGNLSNDLIIPTTCSQLNEALSGGFFAKSLVTIGAGAGVGKTGFSIFLLDSIARMVPDSQTLFYSLEMEAKHIWMRHVGICAGNLFENLDEKTRLDAIARALEIPMRIYDPSNCTTANDIDFILTNSKLKAREKKVSVIVVDYLGLIENRGNFERNDLRVSDITAKLAHLALELNCIVILLSQINRGASARSSDDRCPYPHDAADSSGSHRSSTLWIGVDRPELYQSDPCYQNQFVVKCRKNRFGDIFEMVYAFNNGTFSTVHDGFFKKPFASNSIDLDKGLFPSNS